MVGLAIRLQECPMTLLFMSRGFKKFVTLLRACQNLSCNWMSAAGVMITQ
jgi:hypothetical protein